MKSRNWISSYGASQGIGSAARLLYLDGLRSKTFKDKRRGDGRAVNANATRRESIPFGWLARAASKTFKGICEGRITGLDP